jgi:energy-converting hydrogenase Eha subunit E
VLSQRMQLVLAQNDQPTSDSNPVTLQIQHVQGPLLFLGFGHLVALLVFIMEIIKKPCLFNRNLHTPQ